MTQTRRTLRELRSKKKQRERQSRSRAILVQLELLKELSKLGLRDTLMRAYNPPIELSTSDDIPDSEFVSSLFNELIHALQIAIFDCPLLGDYSVCDYLLYLHPIAQTLSRIISRNLKRDLQLKLERVKPLAQTDTALMAINELHYQHFHYSLADHMKFDEHIYFPTWSAKITKHGRLQHQVLLERAQPERRSVITNSGPRTAYRCGIPALNRVVWTEWSAAVARMSNEDKTYPVYVQPVPPRDIPK